MQVTLTLSEDELSDFLNFRKQRDKFEKENIHLKNRVELLISRINSAIAPVAGTVGRYMVVDHYYCDDLWILAGNSDE